MDQLIAGISTLHPARSSGKRQLELSAALCRSSLSSVLCSSNASTEADLPLTLTLTHFIEALGEGAEAKGEFFISG